MPPLRLVPIFKQRPWGGSRLASNWSKPHQSASELSVGWAESWEVSDLGLDQSRVIGGPFDGRSLGQLVHEQSGELLGRHADCQQFPLLFKFLDAAKTLSVQVHPDNEQAQRLAPGQLGKSEAWLVIAAEPGSQLYLGLHPGVDRAAISKHLASGAVADCLQSFSACAGEVFSVPAGTVHAIGAGVCLAEIQQPSDVTFRLFDWNRLDSFGRPRTLHIEEAMQCIDFHHQPTRPLMPMLLDEMNVATSASTPAESHVRREELIRSPYFIWRRYSASQQFELPAEDRCRVLTLIDGFANVVADNAHEPLRAGETLVIPASAGRLRIEPTAAVILLESLAP